MLDAVVLLSVVPLVAVELVTDTVLETVAPLSVVPSVPVELVYPAILFSHAYASRRGARWRPRAGSRGAAPGRAALSHAFAAAASCRRAAMAPATIVGSSRSDGSSRRPVVLQWIGSRLAVAVVAAAVAPSPPPSPPVALLAHAAGWLVYATRCA